MKLTRRDLRKILNDFNSLSNRLLQANFEDYSTVLARFIRYVTDTEIIFDYIQGCGECSQNMEEEYSAVQSGNAIFELGDTDEEEVRNVYSILKYAVDNNIDIHYGVVFSYSNSKKFQDNLKVFNERVTMVLIRHIENYLTNIGIDMGVDDKVVYNITVKDGQLNIANDNSVINATNTVGQIDIKQLQSLIDTITSEAAKSVLTEADREEIENSLAVIQDETREAAPRKSHVKIAIGAMQAIKGTAEFGAAVVALYQFLQPFLM